MDLESTCEFLSKYGNGKILHFNVTDIADGADMMIIANQEHIATGINTLLKHSDPSGQAQQAADAASAAQAAAAQAQAAAAQAGTAAEVSAAAQPLLAKLEAIEARLVVMEQKQAAACCVIS